MAAGVWHHTATLTRFDGTTDDGTTGGYALAEQQLVRRGESDADKAKGWFLFSQLGLADENVSASRVHASLGTSVKGTFESRDDDTAGVFVSYCNMSRASGSTTTRDETLIESFYKVQLTPWVSISPDVQYIVNPGGTPGVKNAWVGSLQIIVSF